MSLIDKIKNSFVVQKPIELSKELVLPGFDGLPLYDVVELFIEGVQKKSLTTRASSLAFRFFLALFPTTIFLLSLLPYIPIENFYNEMLLLLESFLPKNAFATAEETLDDLFHKKHNQLLSFGFVFALYLASDGINAILKAFNDSFHSTRKVSFFKQRFRALILMFILTVLVVSAISLIVFKQTFINYLIEAEILTSNLSVWLLKIGEFIIMISLFFAGFSTIYYYGNMQETKFRFVSAGSTVATILSLLISTGFAYYINHFGNYNKLYGSLGTLIVIMMWLYFNSLVLLAGFEINASIKHAKKIKSV